MEFKSPKWWKEFKALGRKHQASSLGGPAKSQAPSSKPQASSIKLGGPAQPQAPAFVKKKILNKMLDTRYLMGYSRIMKYISIYQTCRLYGGAEEGGWYYTARDKIKDLKKSFSSDAEVKKWWGRIQKAVANIGDRYDLNLEARVFDDKHGPQDFSDQSYYD